MKLSWAIYLAALFILKLINADVKQNENEDVHFLYKRKELPDLNGPPPIESDHEDVPLNRVQTNLPSQNHQTVQANERYTKKRKTILDSTGCVHNSNCVHWDDLSEDLRKKFRIYNWRKRLPEEKRKKMSREQSKRWHSTLTPQEKERRKQLLEGNRQIRMQEMSSEKREEYLARKNKISKAFYQRSKLEC